MLEAMEEGSEIYCASQWSRNHSDMSQVSPEERGAGGQDELVGLDLFLLARDRHIKKVLLFPQLLERIADVPLEVVPLKTKFIPWPHVDTSKIRVTTTSANVTLIKIFTTYLILNSKKSRVRVQNFNFSLVIISVREVQLLILSLIGQVTLFCQPMNNHSRPCLLKRFCQQRLRSG